MEKIDSKANLTATISETRKEALKYNDSGVKKYRQVNFDDAIADYTTAIQLDPELSVAYYNRGTVFYRLGLYDSALIDLTKAVQLDSKNSEFSKALADCQKLVAFTIKAKCAAD